MNELVVLLFQSVYWISTTVAIVAWLFGIRHYKKTGFFRMAALSLYMVTGTYWLYVRDTIYDGFNFIVVSDMLYDVTVLAAVVCVIRSLVVVNKNKCFRDCERRILDEADEVL